MQRHFTRYLCAIGLILVVPLLALAVASYAVFDYAGPLPPGAPSTTITEFFGINNAGLIVGGFCADGDKSSTCAPPGFSPSHGFVFDGAATFLKIDFPNAWETETTGVNDLGRIVGLYDPKKPKPINADLGKGFYCQYSSVSGCTSFHTVTYPGAKSTDLQGINIHGDIVGLYAKKAIPPFSDFGFLLDSSIGRFCSVNIGKPYVNGYVLHGTDTNTLAINNDGDVVGSYDDVDAGRIRAFLLTDVEAPAYKSGKPQACTWHSLTTFDYNNLTDFSVSQTEAAGIGRDHNGKAVIVGNYLTAADNVSHAFKVVANENGTLVAGTFENIDFPQATATNPDNAATAVNNDLTILGNFEHVLPDSTKKESAWVRTP
jgi:hypothetical protein